MPTALRTVLSHLFDDAGLFPPARLPMADALAAHERAMAGPHADLIGPFLCPATRIEELAACVAAGATRPQTLGIIGYVGQLDWRRPMATRGVVQAEAPFDARMPRPPGRIVGYLELPHRGEVEPALDVVERHGARAKVRCGGLTPDAVPSVDWLAEVLVGCARRGLMLKATAGLHHPFRAPAGQPVRHGFVNLLAAAALARSRAPLAEVASVLAADEADASDLPGRVAGARELLASIGTCSLDEPVGELVSRGLL